MAVGYLKENFAFGTLASTLNAAAVTLTMTAGHSLPTASGSFQLVIWDAATYPNPSDDPNVEIVTGSFDTGNAYDITRAQESTSDVEHAAGQKVGLHYTAAVNVDDLDAANHPMARISGSTFSTVQHAQDIFHSSGWISGGAVTDDGDGTITVALGTGLIRATDGATAQILYFDWASEAGANVALVDNDISYVYVEYNGGSPQVIATITQRTDFNKNVLLASVSREGTDVHINQTDQHTVGDHANSMIRRLVGVQPYGRVSGGILSETGSRNIAVTAGDFWRGLTEFTTSAVDTSGAPTFSYYYNSGAGWQKVAAVSDIHQTNYNDFGVGLATLDNNKYGVHWVYIEADDDDIAVVYGIGNYTLSQAEDAQPPSAVPQHLQMEGILAGKIIIKEGAAAFTQVESAFETKFVGSIATDHADLVSLDFASAGHTGFLPTDGSVSATAIVVEVDAANTPLTISCAHDTEATTALLTLRKSDGTIASPALVDDNAVLGTIAFDGYDGSGFHTSAKIEARIDGTPSDGTDMPTELTFWTTPEASATAVQRMAITPDGDVGIGIDNPFALLHVGIDLGAVTDTAYAPIIVSRYFAAVDDARGGAIFSAFRSSDDMDQLVFGVTGDAGNRDSPALYASARMVIQADGKVGIGTTNPISLFHLTGASPTFRFENTGAGGNTFVFQSYSAAGSSRLRLIDVDNSDAEVFSIMQNTGHIGINTISPDGQQEISKDAVNATSIISCYHDTEATTAILTLRKADGTEASPALVDDNAVLGTIAFDGYDGSGWHTGAFIQARIDGTPSDGTDMPTELTFWTTPEASATAIERLAIKSDGGIFPAGMKSGTDQTDASAAAGELYQDTNDDNTIKIGV